MPDTFTVPEHLDVGAALGALVIGTIVSVEDAQIELRFPGKPAQIELSSLVPLGPRAVGTRVVLGFLAGDRARPLILGPLVEPDACSLEAPSPELEGELERHVMRLLEGELEPELASAVRVSADGQRVRVEAEQELELCCGKASITLRANGRVVVRGTQVESRAKGLNRIKGGAVAIN